MTVLRVLVAAFRLQTLTALRTPGQLLILVSAPLFSAIFLSLVVSSGRTSAVVNAVLAPGLIGLWFVSLDLAGEIIALDRWGGRFELLVCSLTPLGVVIFGRVLVIVLFGGLTFAESWLVAVGPFGLTVPMEQPVLFAVGVAATCYAMAGTATLLAAAFALSRGLHVYQNGLSYPFYLLGGVMVPVAALPGWVEPLSRLVFLSWSADLLRGAMRGDSAGWPGRLAAVLVLGTVALLAGRWLVGRVVDRARRTAEVSYA